MYSPAVISTRTTALIDRMRSSGRPDFTLTPYPVSYVDEVVAHLDSLYIPKTKSLTRDLTAEELAFIENERHMCRLDFRYWVERYAHCYLDDVTGNIGRMDLWFPQETLLQRAAKVEAELWEQLQSGSPRVDGICFIIHKARQMGFTMIVQALFYHRLNFYSGYRGLTASSAPHKTKLIYEDRTKILMERLPWWLATTISSARSDEGFLLANESRMVLQAANQTSGIGQGNQYDVSHLTECASWPDPSDQIENHFFKTIPYSIRAMSFLESTAQELSQNGAQWWKTISEQARSGHKSRWNYLFIPWYAEPKKNMIPPPVDWTPLESTLVHAKMVETTSPEWMDGRSVVLSREQLYWYERERQAAGEKELHNFLMNYCATPEESFKFAGASTFRQSVVDILYSTCDDPIPYEIITPATPSSRIYRSSDPTNPFRQHEIAGYTLAPVLLSPSDPISDPRGLVLMWEPPDPSSVYFVGVDTAGGIHDWSRFTSFQGDDTYDNACISIWKHDGFSSEQVAEFAGPIPESQLAIYCNILGRLYAGRNEDGQAPMIIEVDPKGATTQQLLFQVYNYHNFYKWHRVVDGIYVANTPMWGWRSTNQSLRILTAQSVDYINSGRAAYRSRWAVSELEFCKTDPVKMRLAALRGYHDDRVIASMLALWFANDWVLTGDDLYAPPIPIQPAPPDHLKHGPQTPRSWQNTDISYADMMAEWEERIDDIVYGGE